MRIHTKNELINLLASVPSLRTREGRDAWLERQLPQRLVDQLQARRSNVTRDDLTFILTSLVRVRLRDGSLCVTLLIHDVLMDLTEMEMDPRLGERLLELSQRVEEEAGGAPRVPVGLDYEPVFEEVIIGKDEKVPVAFLQNGLRAGKSVARIIVTHINGEKWNGTGWLIAPGVLITNYHVIKAMPRGDGPIPVEQLRQQARSLIAYFGFTGYEKAEEYCAEELLAFDYDLDYALIKLSSNSREGVSIAEWRNMTVVAAQPILCRGDRLNIIQHPDGRVQEFAIRSNYFVNQVEETHRLYYLSDTEGGSSGSPVMNDLWEVVALHRGWDYFRNQYHGQPIQLPSLGLQYQSMTGLDANAVTKINEGVAIHAIFRHLPPKVRHYVAHAQRKNEGE